MRRRFIQCDVFTAKASKGNGLAVVVDALGLTDSQMQDFAAWTNLAETTFLLPPTTTEADYKVRIFTPAREMPFAGHPTLGSCAAWLRCQGKPRNAGVVVQECNIGLITIDLSGTAPAFAAPPTTWAPIPSDHLHDLMRAFAIDPSRVVGSARLANGPVWQVLELDSAQSVLCVDAQRARYPHFQGIGFIGPHPPGSECDYEVRMLCPSSGMLEDPITGSLNAAIAAWKYATGAWSRPISVAQGSKIGREGRVFLRHDHATGTVWVGGQTCHLIEGTLDL